MAPGGAGDVYSAIDEQSGDSVAVKIFGRAWARDPEALARIEKDALRMAALNCAEVANVRDTGRLSDGRPYLVSDWIHGVTLDAAIERGARLDPWSVVALLGRLGAVLDAGHAAGVIHRTLSPSKLAITPSDSSLPPLVLLGVGTGSLFATGDSERLPTLDISLYRSLAYAAPEVTESTAGPPTDVYAMACVVYQLMTGTSPDSAAPANPLAQLTAKRYEHVFAMRDVTNTPFSKDLEQVMAWALASDPANRYRATGAFLSDLLRASHGIRLRGPHDRSTLRETIVLDLKGGDARAVANTLWPIALGEGSSSAADTIRPPTDPNAAG